MKRQRIRSLVVGLALLLAGCRAGAPASSLSFEPDSIPEAYRYSTAVLAWPGAARAFQVTAAGDLWNGEWKVRIAA